VGRADGFGVGLAVEGAGVGLLVVGTDVGETEGRVDGATEGLKVGGDGKSPQGQMRE